MKRLLVIIGLLYFFGKPAAETAVGDPFLVYSAAMTSPAPVIDGVLNDPCWQRAEKTKSFVTIGGGTSPVATRGMVCRDKNNLYIAFICQEPEIEVLKEWVAKKQVKSFEESIEIFIDSDHDHLDYFQFRVDINGQRESRRQMEIDENLSKKWSAAVALDQDFWTVETAIPFKILKGKAPSLETIWGLNLNRQRLIKPEGTWTCWSDTKGRFHSPNRFGHLIFSPYPVWLQACVKSRIRFLLQEIAAFDKKYPKINASFQENLDRLNKETQEFFSSVSSANLVSGDQVDPYYNQRESLYLKYEEFLSDLRLAVIAAKFQKW